MRRTRRGYSFTEVMFAVVVLGIGFIMIAAMFPVAISQQQSTQQESNAASIARAAANYFESAVTSTMLPGTEVAGFPNRPRVFSIRDPQDAVPNGGAPPALWNALKGNLIVPSDRRYGVVMMYRREGIGAATTAKQAQLIVIVTQVRNRSTYETDDIFQTPAPVFFNLQARPVVVDVSDPAGPPNQTVTFTDGQTDSVAEGSYIIIANDKLPAPNTGVMNGRVYRVGAKLPGVNEWELAPGNDFKPYDPDGSTGAAPIIEGLSDADAFIVGRNTTDVDGVYEGLAQDIAVYTTFIQVR